MPRETEISKDYFVSQLKNFLIFEPDGELKGQNNDIWQQIKISLKLKMAAKSVYLYVYNNRHECRSELENFFKIKRKLKGKKRKHVDDDYCPDKILNPCNCEEIQFEIIVPRKNVINNIILKQKQYFWSDTIRDEIWNEQKLPCAFSLNGYITSNQFKFTGVCRDCGSGLRGVSDFNVCVNDEIKFQVKAFATQKIHHTIKNRLAKKRRCDTKKILESKTANSYREDLMENMDGCEPPFLNDTQTYRKAREEALNEAIGFDEFKRKPLTSTQFVRKCYIRKLSLNPLYIMYWSERQIDFWNAVWHQNLPLSFDSTGGMIKRYKFYEGIEHKTMYYYVLVIGFKKKIIPLLQAVLTIHHVPKIVELLQKLVESGAKVPREITTDGSLALQNAICLAFNNETYSEYNLHCFLKIIKDRDDVPQCFYRCDVAHLLRAIKRWKCFKVIEESILNLYLRIIGYLTQANELTEFSNIVTSIVIICNSSSAITDSECCKRIKALMDLLRTYDYDCHQFVELANTPTELED